MASSKGNLTNDSVSFCWRIGLNIRHMTQEDVAAVSAVCMASFSYSVADTVSAEGRETFAKIAAREALLKRMQDAHLLLVAESDGKVNGVIELRDGHHIVMLFVQPEQQQKGIGRKLLATALAEVNSKAVTVRASLPSVPVYQKYGFQLTGEIAEFAGLVYQPMVIDLSQSIHSAAAMSMD